MRTGRFLIGIALVSMAGSGFAATQQAQKTQHAQKKAAKKVVVPPTPPPPLFSGQTGHLQPMPLDSIAAVPPQVSYENNQLTIVAPNSTLSDILRAVRKQTGADIEVPQAPERVVTRLGPGPARDVVAELLNGSRFNYVLLGSPENDSLLTRVVLVAKSSIQDVTPNNPGNIEANRGVVQANGVVANQPEPDMNDQEPPPVEDNASVPEESAPEPPPTEADQQSADPNGVKTPQQMLQEMQQRQMQMQQQQQQQGNGQQLGPSGMPPHPPGREQ